MSSYLENFDLWFIKTVRKTSMPFGRFALFTVFFWFGILKIIGTSQANPMVADLLHVTLPFMSWNVFIIMFSVFEMIIGICFLFPRFERLAIVLLAIHMTMTVMPLVFLPAMTWQGFMTPTLEGQYIIKNLVIIALAMGMAAHLHPLRKRG